MLDRDLFASEAQNGPVLLPEQKKALKAKAKEVKGAEDFALFTIGPKSIAQQLIEDSKYFSIVNESQSIRDLVKPLTFELAFPVNREGYAVPIPKSNWQRLKTQAEMIAEFGHHLKLADEGLKAIMAHAYVNTQADISHQKQTGKVLIPDFLVRTPDETPDSGTAVVGRFYHVYGLSVYDWHGDDVNVWALPAVVPANLEI